MLRGPIKPAILALMVVMVLGLLACLTGEFYIRQILRYREPYRMVQPVRQISSGRIFCWVLTYNESLLTKSPHVDTTWGKRCDRLVYMSDEAAPHVNLTVIGLNTTQGRGHLSFKSRTALDYLYKFHLNDADWFLKADDDTYIIMENLRNLLSDKDPDTALYFGSVFNHSKIGPYASGGAGYVISRSALSLFGQREKGICNIDRNDGSNEDVKVAQCLSLLGVPVQDSLDKEGGTTFHHFSPPMLMTRQLPRWFSNRVKGGDDYSIHNISRYAVSFHMIEPQDMHALEYLIYHIDTHPYV